MVKIYKLTGYCFVTASLAGILAIYVGSSMSSFIFGICVGVSGTLLMLLKRVYQLISKVDEMESRITRVSQATALFHSEVENERPTIH